MITLFVRSSPALFQRVMDTILQGLPGIVCYQDDILVTGSDIEEHIQNLECNFVRMKTFGFHLHLFKCKFLKESVEYRTSPKKIKAILNPQCHRIEIILRDYELFHRRCG